METSQTAADVDHNFTWLSRGHRGSAYISYSAFSHLPSSAFDFGCDGYSGSCNYGGELLQMSARSKKHGIIFARGDFSATLHASLARGQRESGGPCTFGLELSANTSDSSFRLGKMLDRGCFNYRWPFHEYSLQANEDQTMDEEKDTCAIFTFVKGGILYQVLRIEQGCGFNSGSDSDSEADIQPDLVLGADRSPLISPLVLTVGGPLNFRTFESAEEPEPNVSGQRPKAKHHNRTTYTRVWNKHRSIGLEASVYQFQPDRNGGHYELLDLTPSKSEVDNGTKPGSSPAYNAFPSLPTQSDICSITFLATFRLFDADSYDESWPLDPDSLPTSREVRKFVGAGVDHTTYSTGLMWETIFLKQYLKFEAISQLPEIHLIGRCLEEILQVNIVPTSTNSSALVSHLFAHPVMDYKSLFWKVRFLVKLYLFLERLVNSQGSEKTDHTSETEAMCCIAEKTMSRIADAMPGIVNLLLHDRTTSPVPDDAGQNNATLSTRTTADNSSIYYIAITLWYLAKILPPHFWIDLKIRYREVPHPKLPPFRKTVSRNKVVLLQWYHYGSILRLAEKGFLLTTLDEKKLLSSEVRRSRNAALMVSAEKLSSGSPYSAKDEIFDRLAFLAHELDLEDVHENACTVASLSIRRVKERDFTRSINPGCLPSGVDGLTDGPWEVHALCHHSRLMVLNLEHYQPEDWRTDEQKAAEVELYKRKLSHFMDCKANLVPYWERPLLSRRRKWVHAEASSVLASTLLDLHEKGLKPEASKESAVRKTSVKKSKIEDTGGAEDNDSLTAKTQMRIVQELKSMEALMEQQITVLGRHAPETTPPIEFFETSWKTPRHYHPENFTTSLDDTPLLYKKDALQKLWNSMPVALRDHISIPRDFNKGSLYDGSVLKCLYVTDITTSGEVISAGLEEKGMFCNHIGQEEVKEELIYRLHDSLVDLGVRHRILTVRSPNLKAEEQKNLLDLVVYVLCPRSVGCLGNHLLDLSRFSFQNRNEWVARITLISWCYNKSRQCLKQDEKETASSKDELVSLPPNFDIIVRGLKYKVTEKAESRDRLLSGLHERKVSSLVLATNTFGDFSKSTIISELLSQRETKILGVQALRIWRVFVHQPQTARCLVFYLELGTLCRKIVNEYEEAINVISSTIDLKHCFTMEEDWSNAENAVPLLQLGLWSLESLYKLQWSLRESVKSIGQAKDQLDVQIKEGPGMRSEPLERICQGYLDTFEADLLELAAVTSRLERDIDLNSRYKDAFEAILTLTDSRTSVGQNRGVQRLTYVTMVYLPMGLMAALFAIPNEQRVVGTEIGLGWFLGGIALMVSATLAAATVFGRLAQTMRWFKSLPPKGFGGGAAIQPRAVFERFPSREKLSSESEV